MCTDPVLAALAFPRMSDVNWSLSEGPGEFLAYDFAMGTMHSYSVQTNAPVKTQMLDDGPAVPVLGPAVYVNWLSNITRKKTSDV